jgi:hypothetical protein
MKHSTRRPMKLPPNQGYVLLPDEELVPLDPNEVLPKDYIIGDETPELSEEDVANISPDNPYYWYDQKANQVKIVRVLASTASPPQIDWMACDMYKLVADLTDEDSGCYAKIVKKAIPRPDPKPRRSFRDVLEKVVRRKLENRE